MSADLTDEEKAEIGARPIGTDCDYTSEQLAMRVCLSEKLWAGLERMERYAGFPARSAEIRAVYDRMPPWYFYVRSNFPVRIHKRVFGGATILPGGVPAVNAATLFYSYTEVTQPCDELTRVDAWTPEDIAAIRQSENPGYFTDPLGWFAILCNGNARPLGLAPDRATTD